MAEIKREAFLPVWSGSGNGFGTTHTVGVTISLQNEGLMGVFSVADTELGSSNIPFVLFNPCAL